jgi:hypothetical protein
MEKIIIICNLTAEDFFPDAPYNHDDLFVQTFLHSFFRPIHSVGQRPELHRAKFLPFLVVDVKVLLVLAQALTAPRLKGSRAEW